MNAGRLRLEVGVGGGHVPSQPMGRRSTSCQTRCEMFLLTPTWAEERRHRPVGGFVGRRVAASTLTRTRAVNFHGARPPGSGSSSHLRRVRGTPAPGGDGRAGDIELDGYGSCRNSVGEEAARPWRAGPIRWAGRGRARLDVRPATAPAASDALPVGAVLGLTPPVGPRGAAASRCRRTSDPDAMR